MVFFAFLLNLFQDLSLAVSDVLLRNQRWNAVRELYACTLNRELQRTVLMRHLGFEVL